MKKLCLMALILFGLASAAPALAAGQAERLMEQSRQSYVQGRVEQAIVELREAVVQMWQEADLWIEQAVLVNGRAQGYGIYEPRTSNAYTTGQPILVYLEPLGYRHRRTPDGKYNFGLTCDLVVKLPTGEIVAQQRNFQRIDMTSAKPNMELFLSLTYTLSGVKPGKYILVTVLHDLIDGSTASVDTEVVIIK